MGKLWACSHWQLFEHVILIPRYFWVPGSLRKDHCFGTLFTTPNQSTLPTLSEMQWSWGVVDLQQWRNACQGELFVKIGTNLRLGSTVGFEDRKVSRNCIFGVIDAWSEMNCELSILVGLRLVQGRSRTRTLSSILFGLSNSCVMPRRRVWSTSQPWKWISSKGYYKGRNSALQKQSTRVRGTLFGTD